MKPIPQIALGHARHHAFQASLTGGDAHNLAGDCEEPRTVELRGVEGLLVKKLAAVRHDPFVDWYDTPTGVQWVPGREPDAPKRPAVLTVYVKVRCRKCMKCRWQLRRLWTARAISEVRHANRTWFGTLTVGPDRRFWAKAVASHVAEHHRAEGWEMLTPVERTKLLAAQISPEVQRWLKRVRKETKAELRYLRVVEPHKDGFPHYHFLLHERGQPVPKRLLERQWKWGFSSWRLLPDGDVTGTRYCCKYLTKSVQTRICASRRYGDFDAKLVTERLEGATRTLVRRKERLSSPPNESAGGE